MSMRRLDSSLNRSSCLQEALWDCVFVVPVVGLLAIDLFVFDGHKAVVLKGGS